MKTFQNWFSENYPNEEFPKGNINGKWFVDHNIPMIVSCTYCGATMALPSALIDNEGQVFVLSVENLRKKKKLLINILFLI